MYEKLRNKKQKYQQNIDELKNEILKSFSNETLKLSFRKV